MKRAPRPFYRPPRHTSRPGLCCPRCCLRTIMSLTRPRHSAQRYLFTLLVLSLFVTTSLIVSFCAVPESGCGFFQNSPSRSARYFHRNGYQHLPHGVSPTPPDPDSIKVRLIQQVGHQGVVEQEEEPEDDEVLDPSRDDPDAPEEGEGGLPPALPKSKAALEVYSSKGDKLRSQFNCKKLFDGDQAEQAKVTDFNKRHSYSYPTLASEDVPHILSDCEAFKRARGYRTDKDVTAEEREFPLAYVLLVHLDFEHVERLLRALYTPQNVFCIHVDAKAPENLQVAMRTLAKCFPNNLMLSSDPQRIVYAHMTRLMADISCMRDLVNSKWKWRYLINMAATELPLQSNLDTIHILKSFHGLNDIRETFAGTKKDRFEWAYFIYKGRMKKSKSRLPSPPHNITVIKGLAYNTYSREFMDWATTDQRSLDFLKWSEVTFSPDEHYWASLNDLYHNAFLKTPGGFKGHPDKKGYVTKFISWQQNPKHKCQGRVTHNICLFSSLDLPALVDRRELAANKFDLTYDPVAYACVEEALGNRTRSTQPIELTQYRRLYFIRFDADVHSEGET